MKHSLHRIPLDFSLIWFVFALTCTFCRSALQAQNDPQALSGKVRSLAEESFDADGPGADGKAEDRPEPRPSHLQVIK